MLRFVLSKSGFKLDSIASDLAQSMSDTGSPT